MQYISMDFISKLSGNIHRMQMKVKVNNIRLKVMQNYEFCSQDVLLQIVSKDKNQAIRF